MASDTRVNPSEQPNDADPAEHALQGQSTGSSDELADPVPIEPLSLSLLGRLFGVPLIIIGTIVSGAVLVVYLFGAQTSPERRSIDSLIQILESSPGERSAGMLLPNEKNVWQAGLELSNRLEKRQTELTEEELGSATARLAKLAGEDLDRIKKFTASGATANEPLERFRRYGFLLRALGRTGRTEAIGPLIDATELGKEPFVCVAMQEIGRLHDVADVREAIAPALRVLSAPDASDESLLTACTVLSVIARPDDAHVIEALRSIRLAKEGDVSWSAALALARLKSDAGKSTLLDLLDRSFWEGAPRYEVVDESGGRKRYAMPPHRVDEWLVEAISVTAKLDDSDLWDSIERLKSDRSPVVRGRAADVIAGKQSE